MNKFLAAATGVKVRRTFDDDFHTTTMLVDGKAAFAIRTAVSHVSGIKGDMFKAESCLSKDFLNELRGFEDGALDYITPAVDAVIRPAVAHQYSIAGGEFKDFLSDTPSEIKDMAVKYHKAVPVSPTGELLSQEASSSAKILLRDNSIGLDFEYDIGRVEVGLDSFDSKLAFVSALDYADPVASDEKNKGDYLIGLPKECDPTEFVVSANRKVEAALNVEQAGTLRQEVREIKLLAPSKARNLTMSV